MLAIAGACSRTFTVVAKKEVEHVPFLKQVFACIHALFMERENLRQSMQVINEAADVVKDGKNIILFPEGTRSRKGNQLLEFKSGSFKIAQKAKCPIVPVVLYDSFKPFEGKSFRKVITQLHFLPPIPYETFADMKTYEIRDMVVSLIQNQLYKM